MGIVRVKELLDRYRCAVGNYLWAVHEFVLREDSLKALMKKRDEKKKFTAKDVLEILEIDNTCGPESISQFSENVAMAEHELDCQFDAQVKIVKYLGRNKRATPQLRETFEEIYETIDGLKAEKRSASTLLQKLIRYFELEGEVKTPLEVRQEIDPQYKKYLEKECEVFAQKIYFEEKRKSLDADLNKSYQ